MTLLGDGLSAKPSMVAAPLPPPPLLMSSCWFILLLFMSTPWSEHLTFASALDDGRRPPENFCGGRYQRDQIDPGPP